LLVGIAAAVHVYIFVLESLAWTSDRARAVFGTTPEEAGITRALAFNQGFYNLFLAIATVLGIVVVAGGQTAVGATLIFTGAGSMVAAGLVLLLSSPDKARAAAIQLTPPLLGIVVLAVGLAQ
jgi:putative membrane protein